MAGWPVSQPPHYVGEILRQLAEIALANLGDIGATRAQLEAVLVPLLHKGPLNSDRIASGLDMSRRTLFRNLKTEGTSFTRSGERIGRVGRPLPFWTVWIISTCWKAST
ncbi:MAG: hypothetical protein ABJN26_25600 [Stappiaceae bacterium]